MPRRKFSESPKLICPICKEEGFKTKTRLDCHMTLHENAADFECDLCDERVHSIEELSIHRSTHTEERSFCCMLCPKRFVRRVDLKSHHVLKHREKFTCETCGLEYGTEHGLREHQVVHQETNRFECKICKRRFQRSQNLSRHLLIHSDQFDASGKPLRKPYGSSLNSFQEEKQFRCKDCPKSYSTQQGLSYHHLTIHAEKKWKCHRCGKRFGAKITYRIHLANHTNKPFRCEKCGESYSSQNKLDKHLTLHSTGQPFSAEGSGQQELGQKIEQPNGNDGSESTERLSRMESTTPNENDEDFKFETDKESESDLSTGDESSGDFLDSDDESSATDEDADLGDEAERKFHKRARNGDRIASDQMSTESSFYGSVRSGQRRVERDSSSQTESDGSKAHFRTRDQARVRNPMISQAVRSRDLQSRRTSSSFSDKELPTKSAADASLKVVFDVEYRAPN